MLINIQISDKISDNGNSNNISKSIERYVLDIVTKQLGRKLSKRYMLCMRQCEEPHTKNNSTSFLCSEYKFITLKITQ